MRWFFTSQRERDFQCLFSLLEFLVRERTKDSQNSFTDKVFSAWHLLKIRKELITAVPRSSTNANLFISLSNFVQGWIIGWHLVRVIYSLFGSIVIQDIVVSESLCLFSRQLSLFHQYVLEQLLASEHCSYLSIWGLLCLLSFLFLSFKFTFFQFLVCHNFRILFPVTP